MESNMQALDDTRTISDVARGRDYPNHFQADMSATAASPALGPLKLPVAAAGEGIKTLSGNPSLTREALFNEKTDLKKYLEIMIGKSTNAREEVKYKNILAAVIAEDQADIVKEDIGGDENAIQPRTWQEPEGQVSDQPSEGDFREMFDIPETEGGQVQQTIQDGKPLAEDEYQEWDTGMDVNKGVIGKIGDKNWTKDSDENIGSTPWVRKSLMDSPKLANQATWRLLEEEGYDLRGLGLSDKQDLAREYRLDRLNKTDKGMFFRNRFMRKK